MLTLPGGGVLDADGRAALRELELHLAVLELAVLGCASSSISGNDAVAPDIEIVVVAA